MSATQQRFGLSFPPSKAEGKGRGKTWNYTEEQFQELYDTHRSGALNRAQRDELLKAYDITLQTLERRVGKGPGGDAPKASARQPAATEKPKSKDELLDALQDRRDALREELEACEKKIEQLESLDDETIRLVQGLAAG